MKDMVIERARLLRELRKFFDDRGFFEVQPPCLARDCVVDAHLDPISVDAERLRITDVNGLPRYFLQTSPESSMKRMLAAGAPSIYSIGPVFRAGELGDLHHPEFTMLEWYDVGSTQEHAIELLGNLACQMLRRPRVQIASYVDRFRSVLEIDPIEASSESLVALIGQRDPELAASVSSDHDAMLDILFSEFVQPTLVGTAPWIIHDYPLGQAALAKRSSEDPRCASRFELFADGVELANGYDELLDADELVRRAKRENDKRVATGLERLPERTTLERAMRKGLPACCGVALGVDRLLMRRVNAHRLADVMPIQLRDA